MVSAIIACRPSARTPLRMGRGKSEVMHKRCSGNERASGEDCRQSGNWPETVLWEVSGLVPGSRLGSSDVTWMYKTPYPRMWLPQLSGCPVLKKVDISLPSGRWRRASVVLPLTSPPHMILIFEAGFAACRGCEMHQTQTFIHLITFSCHRARRISVRPSTFETNAQ